MICITGSRRSRTPSPVLGKHVQLAVRYSAGYDNPPQLDSHYIAQSDSPTYTSSSFRRTYRTDIAIAPRTGTQGQRLREMNKRLPKTIWALGFVSLLMDISSEMIHALLPVFLVTTLHAGTEMVGLVEGVGEGTASVTKIFSGWLSDRLRRRKTLAIVGYTLGALSKPVFALAPAASWVLGARFFDRVGKGVRGAPRDALVGDLAPPGMNGAAFGLRQSLDTVGAFVGSLLAILLMILSSNNIRLVFWIALPLADLMDT